MILGIEEMFRVYCAPNNFPPMKASRASLALAERSLDSRIFFFPTDEAGKWNQ